MSHGHSVPIYSAPPNHGPTPHYVTLEHHTTVCSHCQSYRQTTQCYAVTHMRKGTATFLNKRPVKSIRELDYNYQIKVTKLPTQTIPMCIDCYKSVSLSHLPSPPPLTTHIIPEPPPPSWVGKGAPKPQTKPVKPQTKTITTKTIDDLLF